MCRYRHDAGTPTQHDRVVHSKAGPAELSESRAPARFWQASDNPPSMRIAIAHSPDSDDAFMFYGLASGKVPTGDLEIEHVLSDIESLNHAAFEGRYEISAISFHAYTHLADRYMLLPHGASMGDRYGPVVVAREPVSASLEGVAVAIPGELTTAFLALRMYKPDVQHVVMPFDQIQEAVHDGRVQAGLIIHEGQLTYATEGLHKVVDFGEWWADRTGGLPLPLGGNVIRRDLGPELITRISRMLRESIAYALDHRDEAVQYAMAFGRGLDREKTDRFVGMYVNELTLEYGDRGREAVRRLLTEAAELGLTPRVPIEFAE
jgi:1,4-dihydroxy-6-naphthoate synthase